MIGINAANAIIAFFGDNTAISGISASSAYIGASSSAVPAYTGKARHILGAYYSYIYRPRYPAAFLGC